VPTIEEIVENYNGGNRKYAGKVWNLRMFQVWWVRYFG
jgi:hypothetical protein